VHPGTRHRTIHACKRPGPSGFHDFTAAERPMPPGLASRHPKKGDLEQLRLCRYLPTAQLDARREEDEDAELGRSHSGEALEESGE
jgi:hypothetical protein